MLLSCQVLIIPTIVQARSLLHPKRKKNDGENVNTEEVTSQENTSVISQEIFQSSEHKLNPTNINLE